MLRLDASRINHRPTSAPSIHAVCVSPVDGGGSSPQDSGSCFGCPQRDCSTPPPTSSQRLGQLCSWCSRRGSRPRDSGAPHAAWPLPPSWSAQTPRCLIRFPRPSYPAVTEAIHRCRRASHRHPWNTSTSCRVPFHPRHLLRKPSHGDQTTTALGVAVRSQPERISSYNTLRTKTDRLNQAGPGLKID